MNIFKTVLGFGNTNLGDAQGQTVAKENQSNGLFRDEPVKNGTVGNGTLGGGFKPPLPTPGPNPLSPAKIVGRGSRVARRGGARKIPTKGPSLPTPSTPSVLPLKTPSVTTGAPPTPYTPATAPLKPLETPGTTASGRKLSGTPGSSKQTPRRRGDPVIGVIPDTEKKRKRDLEEYPDMIVPDDAIVPRSKRVRRLEGYCLTPEERERHFEDPYRPGTGPYDEDPVDEFEIRKYLEVGLTRPEAELAQRFGKRGRETVLSGFWRSDFSGAPDFLFTPRNGIDVAPIDSIHPDGHAHGATAFTNLMRMGRDVRNALDKGGNTEAIILGAIRKFIKWSIWDVRHYYPKQPEINPKLCIAWSSTSRRTEAEVEESITRRMQSVAESLRKEAARLESVGHPWDKRAAMTVFGLGIYDTWLTVFSLNARNPDAPLNILTRINSESLLLDWWTAITIALTVCAARDDELERNIHYQKHSIAKPVSPKATADLGRGWTRTTKDEDEYDPDN